MCICYVCTANKLVVHYAIYFLGYFGDHTVGAHGVLLSFSDKGKIVNREECISFLCVTTDCKEFNCKIQTNSIVDDDLTYNILMQSKCY